MHNALTSGFTFRLSRLSGLFLGTYSALPYAALCRVAQRVRPVRCGFAVEYSVEGRCVGQPSASHAVALINRLVALVVGEPLASLRGSASRRADCLGGRGPAERAEGIGHMREGGTGKRSPQQAFELPVEDGNGDA
jgi:hypothetical protein